MQQSSLLEQLIEALCCLPSVGPKSAQRMAFYLLEHNRKAALNLSERLKESMEKIGHCQVCRTYTESDVCNLCENPVRDRSQLCIVETPADVMVLEQASIYKGLYFVLMGHLSPLDGIGPQELGMGLLAQRVESDGVSEVILATNATVEGEATAHYIRDMLKQSNIIITRIAHGVPLGGELEYVDGGTLSHAFVERKSLR